MISMDQLVSEIDKKSLRLEPDRIEYSIGTW